MTLVVRRASAEEILPLRQEVLRPGLPVAASRYPEDAVAVHVGGWDGDVLVGCATVFADAWTGESPPPDGSAWRLRGMAVDAERQGTGVGAAVLAEAVAAARASGTSMMWANARSTALGFYLRHGWRVAGPEFATADTGLPHVPIVLEPL